MRNNSLSDNFLKIALDQGLIKQSELEEKSEKKVDNSLYDMLYGVSEKSGREIIDEAHKDVVVLVNTHDKLNGVVENANLLSDVMIGTTYKQPSVNNLGQIYAKANQDLLSELIKTAFIFDRDNQEELMSLADSVAESMTKFSSLKSASPLALLANPYVLVAGATIALLGGMAYSTNNPESQGLKNDIERALYEIADVVANDYEQLQQPLSPLVARLNSLSLKVDAYLSYVGQLSQTSLAIKTESDSLKKREEIGKISTTYIKEGKFDRIKDVCEKILEDAAAILSAIPEAQDILTNASSMYEESSNSFWAKLKSLKEEVVNSDAIDAVKSLGVLSGSLKTFNADVQKVLRKIEDLRSMVDNVDTLTADKSLEELVRSKKPEDEKKSDSAQPVAKNKSRREQYEDYLKSDKRHLTFDEYLASAKA